MVVVRNLTRAEEHNGRTGKIVDWSRDTSRYSVELEGRTSLSLRPENLTQKCRIKIVGIHSQRQLNGKTGQIIDYEEQQGRYTVHLDERMSCGREMVGLAARNVILSTSTRVIIQGLSNEDFNGLMAQIVDVDLAAGRYVVQCQNGHSIKIKYENVLC